MSMHDEKAIPELSCADVLARIDDYLDGELEPGERERVDRHLAGCETCARVGRELAAMVLALHAHLAGTARVPGLLRERFRQTLGGKPC